MALLIWDTRSLRWPTVKCSYPIADALEVTQPCSKSSAEALNT